MKDRKRTTDVSEIKKIKMIVNDRIPGNYFLEEIDILIEKAMFIINNYV